MKDLNYEDYFKSIIGLVSYEFNERSSEARDVLISKMHKLMKDKDISHDNESMEELISKLNHYFYQLDECDREQFNDDFYGTFYILHMNRQEIEEEREAESGMKRRQPSTAKIQAEAIKKALKS